MRLAPLAAVAVAVFLVLLAGSRWNRPAGSPTIRELKARYERPHVRPVDHSKLPALQKKFVSGPEVTAACLSCHTERHREILDSSHWKWSRQEYEPGRGIRLAGKSTVINNYCVGVTSNLGGCSKCHAGYGLTDAHFDFLDARKIDCLVCHDTTDTYVKANGGLPDADVDLAKVAQHVGLPQRSDCGSCHFFGGGGNNVKHGDLEQALISTNRQVDVHMGLDGGNLDCTACHAGRNHRIPGKLYSVSSMNHDRVTCEQCHGAAPHGDGLLNAHTARIACQTCHIPEYAKANATKVNWDWSTAGRLSGGKPFEQTDRNGNLVYASIKGTFTWGRNLKPEYAWFNGAAGHYLLGDTVGAKRPVQVNQLYGSYDDPNAKIVPVKVHRGRQLYDPGTRMMIQPKLYGTDTGQGAFWKDFDWPSSAREGMQSAGLPYSGRYEFVNTEMYWPLNHMVAPKDKALGCTDCHNRTDSRLAGLAGFYMPGRDRSRTVDGLGGLLVAAALAGSILHGAARILARRRRSA